jgi:hypothetical protein
LRLEESGRPPEEGEGGKPGIEKLGRLFGWKRKNKGVFSGKSVEVGLNTYCVFKSQRVLSALLMEWVRLHSLPFMSAKAEDPRVNGLLKVT